MHKALIVLADMDDSSKRLIEFSLMAKLNGGVIKAAMKLANLEMRNEGDEDVEAALKRMKVRELSNKNSSENGFDVEDHSQMLLSNICTIEWLSSHGFKPKPFRENYEKILKDSATKRNDELAKVQQAIDQGRVKTLARISRMSEEDYIAHRRAKAHDIFTRTEEVISRANDLIDGHATTAVTLLSGPEGYEYDDNPTHGGWNPPPDLAEKVIEAIASGKRMAAKNARTIEEVEGSLALLQATEDML